MKKKLPKQRYDAFLFFVLVALVLVFAVVAVQQIRMAQMNTRISSIEGSVMRIESGVGGLVGTVERYERALDLPEQQDGRIEGGVGDRREGK